MFFDEEASETTQETPPRNIQKEQSINNNNNQHQTPIQQQDQEYKMIDKIYRFLEKIERKIISQKLKDAKQTEFMDIKQTCRKLKEHLSPERKEYTYTQQTK